jgi:hypothetical protein
MVEMAELRVSKQETNYLVAFILVSFLIPYLPQDILLLVDNFFIRLALLAGLIAAAYVSPIVAMGAFITLGVVFVYRNQAKIHQLQSAMNLTTNAESPAIQSIETPETAPVQPSFDTPVVESVQFMPQNDSGEDMFTPVAPSMNQKKPLATEGSNDGSAKAISQLFGWVNPSLAQAP